MSHQFFVLLLESIVPYSYLLQAAFFFSLVVVGILLFIVGYLYRHHQSQQKKKTLLALFSDLIAEMALCDSETERRNTLHCFLAENTPLIKKRFARKVLIREIVRTMDSISGGAADNLCWLYETLDLDKDTIQRFSSNQWHHKASAIQHLADMQQSRHLVKIYRETNNRHLLVRTEAQIAVVKLTGFKGLRFLNIVSHPISQWQQLSLISRLHEGEVEEENIMQWLQSKNETVVEFALRLCQVYKCYDLHDTVVESLHHASATVRLQALQALKEIANSSTATTLQHHFARAGRAEQMIILDMLPMMEGGHEQTSFFTSLLQHSDECIRYRAVQLIRQFSPTWSSVAIRHIKENPALNHMVSLPEKEAV